MENTPAGKRYAVSEDLGAKAKTTSSRVFRPGEKADVPKGVRFEIKCRTSSGNEPFATGCAAFSAAAQHIWEPPRSQLRCVLSPAAFTVTFPTRLQPD